MQIHKAAQSGNTDAIVAALRAGADVNERDGYGRTPLMSALQHACRRDSKVTVETARLLLAWGADPNGLDLSGDSPLRVAAGIRNPAFLEELLRCGADLKATSSRKHSILLSACYQPPGPSKLAILDCLHRAGANLDEVEERPGWSSREFPILACLRAGDFTGLRRLAQMGANSAPLHFTPLQEVVAFGEPSDLRSLAFDAAQVNAKAPGSDWSAWLLALARGNVEIIQWLAENGADLTQLERCGHTALHVATRFGNADALSWLLDLGYHPDLTDDLRSTALFDAAEHNHVHCARILIQRGANATFLDQTRDQPIHEANSREMVQLLVEEGGVDPNAISGAGEWPLREAAGRNDVECMRWLVANGALVDHTSTGETALHEAVKFDALEAISFLLERGADPNAEDVDGWLTFRLASSPEAIRLLWQAGARITRKDLEEHFTDPELVRALDPLPIPGTLPGAT